MTGTPDPLRQTEAHAYQRRRRRIGLAANVVELAALVAIVAVTGSVGGWWALVLLVGGLFLLGLPFGYAGYRLSRAHGLSRQTTGGWLADRLQGAAIGLVPGGAAAAALIRIQRAAGGPCQLAASAAIVGVSAVLAALAPHGAGHVSTLPSVALGFTLASALVSPLVAAYSRRRERAADAYAADLAGEGETFARAMERLVARNLSELEPPRVYHLLTSSHPTPAERIAVARSGGRVPVA